MNRLLLFPLLTLILFSASAQINPTEQWARAGGGTHPIPYSGTPPFQSYLFDMAVDKWGNIYEVGSTFNGLQFTGTTDTFQHYGPVDAFIAKFDKCGNLVWVIINGSQGDASAYSAIAIDTSGNIYVGGYGLAGSNNPFHIHTSLTTDTLIRNEKMMYQKYDPNGKLLWQQYNNLDWFTQQQGMKIRKDGKLLSIVGGTQSGTWQGLTLPQVDYSAGDQPLVFAEFDPQTGNFIQSALIDTMLAAFNNGVILTSYVLDENDNIYFPAIVYGLTGGVQSYPNAVFFGQSINIPVTAATILFKLDKNFNLIKYEIADNNGVIANLTYSDGALYAAGEISSHSHYMTDTTASITSISVQDYLYRVYRLDTGTLAPVWASSPSYLSAGAQETYVAATSKHLYVCSSINGTIFWDGDTVRVPNNTQWEALFKFDKLTGHCDSIYIDSLQTSYANMTSMITTDPQENIIIGGVLKNQFTWGPNTLAPWGGSQSPIFYIEKWGINCIDSPNTADAPYPASGLVATAQGSHSISLQWSDGSPYRISFHVYRSPDGVSNWQKIDTTIGTQTVLTNNGLMPNTWYWYKVAAWNAAGESDYTNIDSAKTDTVTGIVAIPATEWKLYPNPAQGYVTLSATTTNAQDVLIEMSDVTGSKVLSEQYSMREGVTDHQIDVSALSAGYYAISITANGLKTTKPLIKF